MAAFHWIASYPKSGNTWLRLALLSLCSGGGPVSLSHVSFAPMASARAPFDAALDVDSNELTEAEVTALRPLLYALEAKAADAPLLRKVHDSWVYTTSGEPLFPPALTAATLYLVRDPRDVAASFAHHLDRSVDHAIGVMADPDTAFGRHTKLPEGQLPQPIGTWSGNVTSWLDAPGMPAPLVLRYEDMLDAPQVMLTRAAEHLGWAADPIAVARAVAATRFDVLHAEEARTGFIEKPPKAKSFFRRGEAGAWRDTLTANQAARIVKDHGPVMERLGYPV